MTQCTAEVFLKDVARHAMNVQLDSGLHRHLRFQELQNWNHWFELVTWPGNLCIRGDMGTWVFSRVDDMFKFFRNNGELKINPSYWSEKIENGVSGGSTESKEFSPDVFREEVMGSLDGWDLSPEDLKEVTEALEDEVFTDEDGSYGQSEHYRKLYEFDHKGVQFDCEIPQGLQYRFHFLWCLYAIVWGIQQYDALRAASSEQGDSDE